MERPSIPEGLLKCDILPPGEVSTNGDMQAWVAENYRQAMACRDRIEAIKGIVK